jgi:hypothetical protein
MTYIIENDLQGGVHRTICSIIFQHWAYTCFKWYSPLYHGNMFSMHIMILHFRFDPAYSKNKNPLSFCLPPLIWLLFAGTEGTRGDHHSLALQDKNAVYNFCSSLAISCTCRLLERVQGRTVLLNLWYWMSFDHTRLAKMPYLFWIRPRTLMLLPRYSCNFLYIVFKFPCNMKLKTNKLSTLYTDGTLEGITIKTSLV